MFATLGKYKRRQRSKDFPTFDYEFEALQLRHHMFLAPHHISPCVMLPGRLGYIQSKVSDQDAHVMDEPFVPYVVGDRVLIWSSSQKRWFDDGEVQDSVAPCSLSSQASAIPHPTTSTRCPLLSSCVAAPGQESHT
eukprot:5107528-Amphidinium_carterae.1